ncbi:MAG TPA: uroporphyrinogen-III synthase [Xanthobacteraceae bacterium]|jgi:uroporphyrinogen-III synthase
MRLLVTRPEPDGERTAAKLRACGHDVNVVSLLRIEPIRDADIGSGPFAALLMTSANAPFAMRSHKRLAGLRGLPVFAVGRRTAAAAREAGFAEVTSAHGNQRDLVRLVRTRFGAGARNPLLYLAGEDRSGDLAGELGAMGLSVRTVVVYRAVAASEFPTGVSDALTSGRLDGVLHFSRRSAETFLRCASAGDVRAPALKLAHYCLSAQVAEPLVAAGATRVPVASRPEEAALIELVNAVMIASDNGRPDERAHEP